MLIPLRELVEKYNFQVTGVLHVGAHMAEELKAYEIEGYRPVFWIEANPLLIPKLQRLLQSRSDYHTVIQAVVSSRLGVDMKFHIANNGQSSSLLELGTHATEHPEVVYVEEIEIQTETIEHLSTLHDIQSCNFWNLDIQGAELEALKGAGKVLDHVDYIYTEVNEKPLYEGCALLPELDAFLGSKGFIRKETSMTVHGWGDALYMRGTS